MPSGRVASPPVDAPPAKHPLPPRSRPLPPPPAPGTLISSQANLNYVDPVLFIARDTPSNTVRAVVPGGPGLELVADRTLTRTAGAFFEFSHTLTNPGNTTGTYTVTPTFVGGPVNL